MPAAFLDYLHKERDRLASAVTRALEGRPIDRPELVRLRKQLLIVDNQIARWACDLEETKPA